MGEGSTEEKSTSFDGDNRINVPLLAVEGKGVDYGSHSYRALQQGGDVSKQDAWSGEIGNVSNELFEVEVHGGLQVCMCEEDRANSDILSDCKRDPREPL
tara:strand:- start:129 stop:428 length:300 start_codon:yes stop_codon:yes gene_type:complete